MDKLYAVKEEVENVKNIMVNNIGNYCGFSPIHDCLDKVLERGDKIELLVERTEELGAHSHSFRVKSKKLRQSMCRKNLKWTIILGVGCTVLFFVEIL